MERNANPKARAWLRDRQLADDILLKFGIGYHPVDTYLDRKAWGLSPEINRSGKSKRLWLPRGIAIPWMVDGQLWGINIRRPAGEPKYYWIPGGTRAMYNVDALTHKRAAVLVEGEIDALTIQQFAGDMVAAVATGSTHGARQTKWIARLSLCPTVLVAYDCDEAGDKAAEYWISHLSNAKRWRPYWSDANQLAQEDVSIQSWIASGLGN